MKRNLSSQAIKAMAIGMALTMATSTAISGTVVNAYAMDTVELAANDHNNNVTVTSANKQNEEKVTITLTATGGTFSTTTAGAGFLQEDGLKGFIVKKDNTEITSNDSLTATLTDSGTITIDVPTAELTGAKSVTVSYVAPKDTGNKIQFTASGGGLSEEEAETLAEPQDLALENVAVPTDSIDITAPTLEVKANAYNATNNTITLTTKDSEELKEMSANNTGGFTITAAGKADTYEITKVEVPTNAKSTVVLTVGKKAGGAGISEQSEPVLTNGTYNITYNATTAATNAIKDAKGNPLADISETPLKLTVGEGTPTPSGKVELEKAAIDSTKKVITLTAKSSETDLGNNTISQNAKDAGFTIKKGNQAITGNDIKTITVNEGTKELGTAKVNTIKLELTNALADGDYTVEYTAPQSPVIDKLENTTTGLAFTVGNPAEKEDFTFKGTNGTYTFEKVAGGVTLVSFEKATETKAESNGNTFNKGIFKTSKGEYKLVQIGKAAANAETFGTTPDLKTITDTDLAGHLDYVNTIKASAFAGNTGITNITFPAVTNVEASAFSGATNLVTVNLPKVVNVGSKAFENASKLTTVDLGSQVESGKETKIASDTFGGNTALETIVTNPQSQQNITDNTTNTGGNPSIIVLDENQYNEIGAKIEENKYYKTKDGLTFVGLNSTDLAFIGKSSPFTPPSIPHSLDGTFGKEYYVTYDQATGTVKLVGSDNPEKPPVNKNLTVKVGTNILTFTSNDGKTATLTGITTESSAVTAEETAGNTLENGVLTVNGDTYTFNAIGNGNAPVVTGNTIDVVTVLANNLNNVTTINSKAFESYGTAPVREGVSNLNITFPAVTTVGASAFKGATAFAQVHLPKVTEIQDNAFNGATSLTNITIPNVKTIGTSAFQGASKLTEVILPNVESIGINAFAQSGTSASEKPFKIYLGDKATNIGNGAFLGAGGSGTGKLEISTNNQAVIDAVNGSNSNLPEDTIKNAAPFVLSATVTNPTTITLKLSEKVYTEETEANNIKGWFTVNKTVEAPQTTAGQGIKSVTVATSKDKAKDTIVITLEDTNKIDWTHTVTVAYSNGNIKDTATPNAADFAIEGNYPVTNNIQAPAPVQIDVNNIRTRVEANQVKLLIAKSYGIQNMAQVNGNAGFKLTKAGTSGDTYTDEEIEITNVSVADDTSPQSPDTTNVILTVNDTITASDSNLKLEYKGGNQVVAKEGDVIKPIAPIGSTIIANTLDTTAPTLVSAKYTKGSGKITITGSEYLLPVNNVAAINSLFKVEVTTAGKAQATTLPVTNVTVGANSKDIVLTINDADLPTAATGLKVTYTQAANENLDTPQIRDTNYNTLKTNSNGVTATIDDTGRSISTFANTTTGNTEGDVTTIRKP